MRIPRQTDFDCYRKDFPVFTFEEYAIDIHADGFSFSYLFTLTDNIRFRPSLRFFPPPKYQVHGLEPDQLLAFAFHIGMVELISYWKATCAPEVVIKPFKLTEEMIEWWKRLYFNGLGEFFYLNQIETSATDFMAIKTHGVFLPPTTTVELDKNRVLVPVGGGKDSAVTLELLRAGNMELIPFIINPRGASIDSVLKAGYREDEIFSVRRDIDKQLLRMNADGFLNGHTPFSALLAFTAAPSAAVCGASYIALSNESSANESTVRDSTINHQYSKTLEFEDDFRSYLKKYVTPSVNYFSFLRPLNELQIARWFSLFVQHHETFRSCNAGSKTNSWCGHCPKCLFTAIIMAPFIGVERVHTLLKHNILDDLTLIPYLEELTGLSDVKPFECVGTTSEVIAALQMIARGNQWPELVRYYLGKSGKEAGDAGFHALLAATNVCHNLEPAFFKLLATS